MENTVENVKKPEFNWLFYFLGAVKVTKSVEDGRRVSKYWKLKPPYIDRFLVPMKKYFSFSGRKFTIKVEKCNGMRYNIILSYCV